jgi:hypothetical protein
MDNICTQRRFGMLYNIPLPRYTPSNPYINGDGTSTNITQEQLNMRRKVEILKYNKQPSQTNRLTRAEKFVQRIHSRYSITPGTDLTELNCPNNSTIPTLSTSSDIPGPTITLQEDSSISLYNYNLNVNGYGDQITFNTLEFSFNPYYNIECYPNTLNDIAQLIIRSNIQSNISLFNYKIPISMIVSGTNIPMSNINNTIPFEIPNIVSVGIYYNDDLVTQHTSYSLNNELISFSITDNGSSINENTIVPNTYNLNASLFIGYIEMKDIQLITENGFVYTYKINLPTIVQPDYITTKVICNVDSTINASYNCTITTSPPNYTPIEFIKL